MKKKVKKISYFASSIILLVLLCTIWNFDNDDSFSSIVTFLSITTGFSTTALSIIAISNFSKSLYLIESKGNNSSTLLHELVSKFKTATLVFVFTIALILIYGFLPEQNNCLFWICSCKITFSVIMKGSIWYLTGLSFVLFFDMFITFSKFIIRSISQK
jgi:hypothetical protein